MDKEPLPAGQSNESLGEMPDDWYWKRTHTREEYEAIYLNPEVDNHLRESAYWGYWKKRLEGAGIVSRAELTDLLRFSHWIYAVNEILLMVCREGRLLIEDAHWLLTVVPADTFGYRQVLAFSIQEDPNLDWQTKLRRSLELGVDWLAERVLSTLPLEHAVQAQEMIIGSERPRRARRHLISILEARQKPSPRSPRASKKRPDPG